MPGRETDVTEDRPRWLLSADLSRRLTTNHAALISPLRLGWLKLGCAWR
jgi:hypothetical protein